MKCFKICSHCFIPFIEIYYYSVNRFRLAEINYLFFKVAQDLGALFGTQSVNNQNHTYNYKNHDHDHDHDHDHEHEHEHDHEHGDHGDQHKHENSSEAPKVTLPSKGQKENVTKLNKSKSIEVRKKSVDWSQYFGIDKRRKKAALMAGQGTQNQDDEWMLQRYYEVMIISFISMFFFFFLLNDILSL